MTRVREYFVYWRVASAEADQAERAAHRFQAGLCRAHAGLRAALYRRADETGPTVTLMEVYACGASLAPPAAPSPRAAAGNGVPDDADAGGAGNVAGGRAAPDAANAHAALERSIVAGGNAELAAWLQGPRKVEIFVKRAEE